MAEMNSSAEYISGLVNVNEDMVMILDVEASVVLEVTDRELFESEGKGLKLFLTLNVLNMSLNVGKRISCQELFDFLFIYVILY